MEETSFEIGLINW